MKFRTKTAADVRRTLSRVVNLSANGEMNCKTASAITFACNTILQSIRIDEQQRKIEELEAMLEEYEKHAED